MAASGGFDPKKVKALQAYVDAARKQGMSSAQLKLGLFEAGWPKAYIALCVSDPREEQQQTTVRTDPKQRLQTLLDYIEKSLAQGHDAQTIHNTLLSAGWKSELITKSLQHTERMNQQSGTSFVQPPVSSTSAESTGKGTLDDLVQTSVSKRK